MDIADKLWSKTRVLESGCWMFIGGWSGAGYGVICDERRRSRSAHAVAYEACNGAIPKGLCVCHKCDNKWCVNPEHLFLGTHQDNKDDEIAKGRHVRGSRQGNSKLKEADIPIIRKLIAEGRSLKEIGRQFNVTGEAIGLIKNGSNWSWLQ